MAILDLLVILVKFCCTFIFVGSGALVLCML